MNFRKAVKGDALVLAKFMLLAMKEIVYRFIGSEDEQEALAFMNYFTEKENNQYSFQNCWIVELSGEVVAVANVYDGASLVQLRAPVLEYIAADYTAIENIEDETCAGEFYLDTIAVSPDAQGKGVGSKLLFSLIDHYVKDKQQILGLLVDENNPNARKLYERIGFRFIQNKNLMGKSLLHLQFHPEYLP